MRTLLRSVLVDVLLAIVFTGLALATLVQQRDGRPSLPAVLFATLSVAPIAWRQRAPVLTVVAILVGLTGYAMLGNGEFPDSGVGLLFGMFTAAMLCRRAVVAGLFVAALAVMAIAYSRTFPDALPWSQILQIALLIAGVWALGESTREWSTRAERLAAQAARAAANERVRIARELHDIVSHHMSVISLQAGLAEYVLDADPPTARTAIATVGEASRDALLDMRRLLDVLRVEPGDLPDTGRDDGYRPQPGLAQLEELVNRTRTAGVPVDVTVTGTAVPLPPGPDLCAYRVVQESLTNVLKHAGPASARVEVEYSERALTVRISDTGGRVSRSAAVSPTSHGIKGMRERAELYGGVLTASPADGGGFTVELRLPVGAAR
ncbi:sensor histidine kinase [Virgisporangium aliadipatigenens]|uniref:sensor histidine kinase n=1 Tax=Virgisporangium aliadipatigenens TaxID=741659 RepID=UPI001EF34272|nr:sensor histidine kinase [Virgisporangium aliadipatigenens]